MTSDTEEVEKWRRQFAALYASIPEEALRTVMDMHS
jgi:hypothetical protein